MTTAGASSPLPTVLVTAAAGKTGRPVVAELLRRGLPVRAMVRRDDHRAAALRAQGAEVVLGDLRRIADLHRVLRGVQRAYWAGPIASTTLEAAVLFASAAEDARLEVVVALSQWLADPGHASAQTRMEWLSDRVFSWMPTVGSITVDPGFFAENYLYTLGVVAQFGRLTLPFGNGLNAPPSNEDIGAVAASLLADPGGHLGHRYRPTGPTLVSPLDVADVFARVLDRPVRYHDVPFVFMAKAASVIGFDGYTVAQLRAYVQELRLGTFAIGAPTTAVEDLVGRAPESMETIARRYAANDPMTVRRAAAFASAVRLMARTVATPTPRSRRSTRTDEGGQAHETLAQQSSAWRASHTPALVQEG